SLLGRPGTLALLLGLVAMVSAPRLLAPLLRRRRGGPTHAQRRPGLGAVKALAVVSALCWLGFVVAAVVALLAMLAQGSALIYTYPSQSLLVALAFATAAAAATLLELLALVPVWGSRWAAWPKLRYTLAVLLGVATVLLMWHWNLVGMRV